MVLKGVILPSSAIGPEGRQSHKKGRLSYLLLFALLSFFTFHLSILPFHPLTLLFTLHSPCLQLKKKIMANYYQASSPPTANRSTKPGYSPSASNAYVANNNSYIASPFDDDPVPQSAYNPSLSSHSTEKDPYSNPYNPDFVPKSTYNNSPNSNSNRGLSGDNYQGGSFHQSSHSTQEHALSPSFKEKSLAGGAAIGAGAAEAGGQTYAMQHLNQNDSYNYNNNNGGGQGGGYPFGSNNPNAANSSNNYAQANPHYYNGYDEERPSLSNDTSPMRPYNDAEAGGLTRGKSGVTRLKYGKEKSKYLPCFPCIRSTCGRFTCCFCLILLLGIIALVIVIFTVFKLPKVEFKGMDGQPAFTYNQGGSTFAVNLTANIEVQNPNPIGFNFESITATVSALPLSFCLLSLFTCFVMDVWVGLLVCMRGVIGSPILFELYTWSTHTSPIFFFMTS